MTDYNDDDDFAFENGVLLVGPFLSEIFLRRSDKKLKVQNLTAEGPENASHASIMIPRTKDGPGESTMLPIGESSYDIPYGATIVAQSDDDSVHVALSWQ